MSVATRKGQRIPYGRGDDLLRGLIAIPTDGCIEWPGARTTAGYAEVFTNGQTVYGHRLAYEIGVGPIPEGLTIDHLCRTRACVNPAHLEPVARSENISRAWSWRTHCKHGHPYAVYGRKRRGSWECSECKRRWGRTYRAKKRGAA